MLSRIELSSRLARLLCLAVLVSLGTSVPEVQAGYDWDSTPSQPSLVYVEPVGTRRHDVIDQVFRDFGQAAQFASVGSVSVGGSLTGSGTLIHRNWVLTAAHLFSSSSVNNPGNVSFQVGGSQYTAEQVILHPEYVNFSVSRFDGVDLALVRLSSSVAGVAPAVLNSHVGAEIGQVGTYVGFGRGGTGLTGQSGSAGTKRAGNNVIDVDGSFFSNLSDRILLSDFDHPTDASWNRLGSAAAVGLEYCLASGDSGGGHFIETDGGWLLVGVNSFVATTDVDSAGNATTPTSSYGWLSGTVRVASHHSWIVQTVPEPSSLWLVGVIVAGGGAAYRRKWMIRK